MKRPAIWLLLLAACTRTVEVKADSHTEEHATEAAQAQQDTSETKEQGASTITTTTTTEVYQPVVDGRPTNGAPQEGQAEEAAGGVSLPRQVGEGDHRQAQAEHPATPPAGSLIRRTTTTRVEQRGPVTVTKAAEVKEATAATLDAAAATSTTTATTTQAGPGWRFWLLIFAGAALAAWLAWKFRPPFLRAL